jgi:hypothetical protein
MENTKSKVSAILVGLMAVLAMAGTAGAVPSASISNTVDSVDAQSSSDFSVELPDDDDSRNESSQSNAKENGQSPVSSDKKPAAVGRAAPDHLEPRQGVSTNAFLTDSDSVETNTGILMELESEMYGSFSSGWEAKWTGGGEALATATADADQIYLKQTFEVSGISVTISYPPAASGSGSSVVIDEKTVSNEGRAYSAYSNLEASSRLVIYDATQKDTATFDYGSSSFTLFTEMTKF